MSQKNSFISMLEQISVLNKNSVEIISKLHNIVGSKDSNVTVNYLSNDGSSKTYELPSIGFLKQQIDLANSNIEKLSSLNTNDSVVITTENSSHKLKSIDLNREPEQISGLNLVSSFNQDNNWFFESLVNPLLSVEIDLEDKIDDNVKKILSRRYIVQFEKDPDGNYTTDGLASKQQFEDKFLYKNNITIKDFEKWLYLPTNTGVKRDDESQFIDEQLFDTNYKQVDYKGFISVLKQEKDTQNKKLWYHVNTLNYYDREGNVKSLAVGDILGTTRKNSYSKWKIIEVNTSSSNFRLNLERIEGYEPVAIGTNVLQIISPLTAHSKIKVSIGFDEYNVIFLKAINTETGIISFEWSKGMSFYTNDLNLNTDSHVSMADFYLNKVYDYGAILKDLVVKNIPSKFGSKPNKPELDSDNFKVVQINKHATDTKDHKTLKKLHGQKNTIKAKINQINNAIVEKNRELNVKQFKSVAERSKSHNELQELIVKQQSETKLFSSYVSQITNSKIEITAPPKFRIRGFWEIPDAIIKQGFKPQEVIGFEIQWRYGSKFGTQNITEGFEIKTKSFSTSSQASTQNLPNFKKKTGYFSTWNNLKSDIRKRTFNETTDEWEWEIEDISDADTPNINQLDIPIQKNEKVEIRVRSISEVGYPDAPIYSDWSDIMTIEFPDSLTDVLGDSEFILKEATQEEVKVQFENELSAKGLNRHVLESYYENEQYIAHTDKVINTSFKDSFGNSLSLFDYLTQMTNKIKMLEEAILRAKGELKVTLFRGTSETEIKNGAHLVTNIECEDYMEFTKETYTSEPTITIQNHVYMISDYYLKIENIANQNPLGILTNELYNNYITPGNNTNPSLDIDGNIGFQEDNQFLWFMKDGLNEVGAFVNLYSTGLTNGSVSDVAVTQNYLNITNQNDGSTLSLLDYYIWNSGITETLTILHYNEEFFGATVHPKIKLNGNINELVDNNNDQIHMLDAQENVIIPLNLYFKPSISDENEITFNISKDVAIRTKMLRIKLTPENSPRAFDFSITFKFRRHKQYVTKYEGLSQNGVYE